MFDMAGNSERALRGLISALGRELREAARAFPKSEHKIEVDTFGAAVILGFFMLTAVAMWVEQDNKSGYLDCLFTAREDTITEQQCADLFDIDSDQIDGL